MARGFNYAPGASAEVAQAQETDLDREQLVAFASSRNPVVRERVAERQDLPISVTVTLAHDSTTDVRLALAANPAVSEAILEHLAGDRQRAVVIAVARNPRASDELLARLEEHRRPEVRAAARETRDRTAAPVTAASAPKQERPSLIFATVTEDPGPPASDPTPSETHG
ncbi:hypothetical protein [Demequina salsinemoris]|uniref:variant leucine-rich repeat-containing protein n=1 Tax=Demequina salsinemoris TaxID=577470 RepID=UPI0007850384|nr:hypothetical protein [Demequina salsinemoris]